MSVIKADQNIDARYGFLRARHGQANPQANGYRLGRFFEREQRVILSVLDQTHGPFLDVACGSGLMLAPLLDKGHTVYGLDFNKEGCTAAAQNGLTIVRGDAFQMPFSDQTLGQIINCQFLNQQPSQQTQCFIEEGARVLKSGGQLIILWRHARSLIHKTSHSIFTFLDKFTGQPPFPQYEHPIQEIRGFASTVGLKIKHEAVTLPFLKPDTMTVKNLSSNIIGASFFIVLEKP